MDYCLIPTSYMPSIEYVYLLSKYEKAVIEQFETFPKQTCRNRTEILTDKGIFRLSIPVSKPVGNCSKTNEIKICYHENWIQKHWRTIESAYNSSPFFLYYKDELLQIIERRYEFLIDLNENLLKFFLQKLKIQTIIKRSSRFYKETAVQPVYNMLMNKKNETSLKMHPYHQVFMEGNEFVPNMSIIDLLFNKGSEAAVYLRTLKK